MVKKIVVYSAIFGNYDEPPVVEQVDPNIEYQLFTDDHKINAGDPWQVKVVNRVFEDPQLDARRVKILSHLFIQKADIVVWIDANISLKAISATQLESWVRNVDIALPKHLDRNCIYQESIAVLQARKESPQNISKQMRSLQSVNFPVGYGLHATMLLVRNFNNSSHVKRFNQRWWEILFTYSKRDQLSFDYVRWEQSIKVKTLDLNYKKNNYFSWGTQKVGNHKEKNPPSINIYKKNLYSKDVPNSKIKPQYNPIYDFWPQDFLLQLYQLNQQISKSDEKLEGNLFYFNKSANWLNSPPDPRRGYKRDYFLAAASEAKNIMEIGFNAGHSALLLLNFTGANYFGVDIGLHQYTQFAADHLGKEFPNRFKFLKADSQHLFNLSCDVPFSSFDTFHIDGGHSTKLFINDLLVVLMFAKQGARLIVDDVYASGIGKGISIFLGDGYLTNYRDIQTSETATYIIVKNFPVASCQDEFVKLVNTISLVVNASL